jgi:hypothetical protein
LNDRLVTARSRAVARATATINNFPDAFKSGINQTQQYYLNSAFASEEPSSNINFRAIYSLLLDTLQSLSDVTVALIPGMTTPISATTSSSFITLSVAHMPEQRKIPRCYTGSEKL